MEAAIERKKRARPVLDRLLAAAAALAASGEPMTYRALAAATRITRDAAKERCRQARLEGLWDESWVIDRAPCGPARREGPKPRRVRPRASPVPRPARPADRLGPADRMILELAAEQFAATGEVAQATIGRRMGKPRNWINGRAKLLRGWGLWPYESAAQKPLPHEEVAANALLALEAAYEGLGDGRAEVDDPKVHGICCAPRSGYRPEPEPSLRRITRSLFRDWQVRTGRRAAPEAKAPENHVHNVKSPREPREARSHRYVAPGRPMTGRPA